MTKKLLTLALAVMLIGGTAMAQMFTLSGKVDGLTDGKAELMAREGRQMVTKFATGIKEDGTFMMKGKITNEEKDLYYLKVGEAKGYVGVFMDNVDIKVTGNAENIRAAVVHADGATGDYSAYNQMLSAQGAKNEPLIAKYRQAYQDKDEAKKKELQPAMDAMYEANAAEEMAWIKEHIKSGVAPYLVSRKASRMDDPVELEELINGFCCNAKGSKYLKGLNETLEIKKLTAIGVEAPEFTQNDVDGNPVSLSDFRGKYVLIDFWAAWCGPCRAENPNVVEAFKKFKRKGFTVLGVSLDRSKEDWLKAIEDDGLNWTQVSDLAYWDNAVSRQYGIRSIPANLLVDKKGVIVAKNLRGEKLHETLKKVLK